MARVTLTPVNKTGAKGLTIPAAGTQSLSGFTGVQFVNNGQMTLLVYNGSGTQTITQQIGRQVQGLSETVAALAITASTNVEFGPWSASDYMQVDGSGMTYIDFGGVPANITVTLYQTSPVS
jgi:hypothetical protein